MIVKTEMKTTGRLKFLLSETSGAFGDRYWKGFGLREHALLADSDAQFWIDWLVTEGKIKEGQFKPSDSIRTVQSLLKEIRYKPESGLEPE